MLIDIPVGLQENKEKAALRPDAQARSNLQAERKPTIFPAPCCRALHVPEYAEASKENERVLGKKLTRQSYASSKKLTGRDRHILSHREKEIGRTVDRIADRSRRGCECGTGGIGYEQYFGKQKQQSCIRNY